MKRPQQVKNLQESGYTLLDLPHSTVRHDPSGNQIQPLSPRKHLQGAGRILYEPQKEGAETVWPWAPAPGGQWGHMPTLEIIWVCIAHPGFFFFGKSLSENCPPWILCNNSRSTVL